MSPLSEDMMLNWYNLFVIVVVVVVIIIAVVEF